MSEEKIDANYWRVKDFWGRHSITSRVAIMALVLIALALTGGFIFGLPVPAEVLTTIFWSLTAIVIAITLGPNAIEQATDLISKIKGFR